MISEFPGDVLSFVARFTSKNSHIPWLDEVCHSEDCAKHYANASNGYICDSNERILATHDRSSGYDN